MNYGENALLMLCPRCKGELEAEWEDLNLKPTKNPIKAMRQSKKLISAIDRICCDDCLNALYSEGVRWAHDHPEEIKKAKRKQ